MATPSRRKRQPSEIIKILKELIEVFEKYGNQIRIFTEEQYHTLKLKFNGKSIAIIGPKAAGKTTFVNILKNPNYEVDTMNYTPTQGVEAFKSTKVNYKIPLTKDKKEQRKNFKLKKPESQRCGKHLIEILENNRKFVKVQTICFILLTLLNILQTRKCNLD